MLDEPVESVQPSIIADIARVIALLRGRGEIEITLVEQLFDFNHELGQHLAVMDRGSIVLAGFRGELDRAEVLQRVPV